MKRVQLFALLAVAASAATAQGPTFDFLHMPKHTVELLSSQLDGKPQDVRLRGYYLYREDGQIFLLSHRPEGDQNEFVASAYLDAGSFSNVGIVDRGQGDDVNWRGRRAHWDLKTWHEHVNGVAFRPSGAHYIVFDLRSDQGAGKLPAIFIGKDQSRYQSGSGLVLVDMLR